MPRQLNERDDFMPRKVCAKLRQQPTTQLGSHLRGIFVAHCCVLLANTAFAQQPFGGKIRYVQPTVLSDAVNDLPDGADSPSISGDDLTLYYTGYADLSRRATLWQASRSAIDADWEASEQMSDAVHNYARQMEPEVTSDGLELYFRATDVIRNYDWWTDKDILVVSTRISTDEEWGPPTPLPDVINESFPCLAWPSITGDGLELYFAGAEPYEGDRCGGRSSSIYVSKRSSRDAPWGEPQLVEPLAWAHGISPDGLQLFFSDGEREGTDLFVPTMFPTSRHVLLVRTRASRDEEFGDTIELGSPPNLNGVSHAALGVDVSTDGETIYFHSNRSGAPTEGGIWQWQPASAELCDINADGSCDVGDLAQARDSLFARNLVEGSDREFDIPRYDISGDGTVNQLDLETWLAEAARTNGFTSAYLAGDANLDGTVDFSDFLALSEGFGSGRDWADGNFNGDRDVDFTDFLALSANFGSSLDVSQAATVPEPSSVLLLVVGVVAAFSQRKRRKPSHLFRNLRPCCCSYWLLS